MHAADRRSRGDEDPPRGASLWARCPRCQSALSEVSFELTGRALRLEACTACGLRRWYDRGRPTPLTGVLEAIGQASGRRPRLEAVRVR